MPQILSEEWIEERRKEFRDHAERIGTLVARFHLLDESIRSRLQMMPDARPMGTMAYQDMYQYSVGTELPETEITGYESLRDLIKKHNRKARERNYPELDLSLADLRDALAHGRVERDRDEPTWRLIHFSRPKNGLVKVIYNAVLSGEWYEEQIQSMNKAAIELIKHRNWWR